MYKLLILTVSVAALLGTGGRNLYNKGFYFKFITSHHLLTNQKSLNGQTNGL